MSAGLSGPSNKSAVATAMTAAHLASSASTTKEVQAYKSLLTQLHSSKPRYQRDLTGFFNLKYAELGQSISQDLVSDASKAMASAGTIFQKDALRITFRPEKQLSRVQTKYQEELKSQATSASCNHFRVISDISAGRFPCKLLEIDGMVAQIQSLVERNGGWCVIKGADETNPNGNFKTAAGECKDIINYIYVYLPEVGHIMEIQIGSQFAMDKFAIDSDCREKRVVDTEGDKAFRKEMYKLSQEILKKGNNSMDKDAFDAIVNAMVEKHQPKNKVSLDLISTLEKELCKQPSVSATAVKV